MSITALRKKPLPCGSLRRQIQKGAGYKSRPFLSKLIARFAEGLSCLHLAPAGSCHSSSQASTEFYNHLGKSKKTLCKLFSATKSMLVLVGLTAVLLRSGGDSPQAAAGWASDLKHPGQHSGAGTPTSLRCFALNMSLMSESFPQPCSPHWLFGSTGSNSC